MLETGVRAVESYREVAYVLIAVLKGLGPLKTPCDELEGLVGLAPDVEILFG